jgi:hypothetical protein
LLYCADGSVASSASGHTPGIEIEPGYSTKERSFRTFCNNRSRVVLHHAADTVITKLFEPACLPAALASRVAVSISDYGVIKLENRRYEWVESQNPIKEQIEAVKGEEVGKHDQLDEEERQQAIHVLREKLPARLAVRW